MTIHYIKDVVRMKIWCTWDIYFYMSFVKPLERLIYLVVVRIQCKPKTFPIFYDLLTKSCSFDNRKLKIEQCEPY